MITYISFRCGQAELDEADFGLLHTGHSSVHHPLSQHQTIHHLTVINGPAANTNTMNLLLQRDTTNVFGLITDWAIFQFYPASHPSFLTMRILRRSTLVAVAGSMAFMTASTLMGARRLEYWDTTLEQSEVVALFRRVSLSLSCTGWLMDVRISTPLSTAFWKDSEMMVGWIPAWKTEQKDHAEFIVKYT